MIAFVLATGRQFWGLSAATWSAIAAWATLAVLLITAVFAAVSIRDARRRSVAEAAEARRVRNEQMRPFVVVDFDTARVPQFIYVTIENTGRTVAKDVAVTFDPPLSSSISKAPDKRVEFFQHPFPTLPPGKSARLPA